MEPTGYLGHLRCPRCGSDQPELAASAGCPACAAAGVGVNLHPAYRVAPGPLPESAGQPGLFRYRQLLPLPESMPVVSLAEGGTPLLRLGRLGTTLGVPGLLLKDESRNPTGSFKARLAAVAVTRAVAGGAATVAAATSGNHGVAVAAYAARAGLGCVVLARASVPESLLALMHGYGARVHRFESGPDRWAALAAGVAEHGWFPASGFRDPPIGSNPFGVDGYKTIAYELWRDLGRVPDVVVLPAAYGDGLAGVWRGFQDLRALGLAGTVPRLVAVDPFGAYAAALADPDRAPRPVPGGRSVAFSVATRIATWQGVAAVRHSGGTAVAEPSDRAILDLRARLAGTEGVYLEATCALPLVAVRKLVGSGWLHPEQQVVVIATAAPSPADLGLAVDEMPDIAG